MDQKFLHRTFRLSALTLAIVALGACGGGGSSGGGGGTPPPAASDDETTVPPGTVLAPVDETLLETSFQNAIDAYTPLKRAPESNQATAECAPTDFYIVSDRRLQVGFKQGVQLNGKALTEAQRVQYAKIAGLALDSTLTNYGFSGSEAELQNAATPYYVCVVLDGVKLNTRSLLAEVGPFDGGKGFYRQAKDQFANSFVERLRTTPDNYDQVYFWFDEGLSNFAGDNRLVGSPKTWIDTVGPSQILPRPLDVQRITDAKGSPEDAFNTAFYQSYPFYATVIAYFLDDQGLGLERTDLADWLKAGVSLNNFGAGFDSLGLGGSLTYSKLKTDHVTLIHDWLKKVTATTELSDLTSATPAVNPVDVTEIVIERKPGWQFQPILGENRIQVGPTSLNFDSLTYTLSDDSYNLYFRAGATCYGGMTVQVTNGKAVGPVSAAPAKSIDCATIPL